MPTYDPNATYTSMPGGNDWSQHPSQEAAFNPDDFEIKGEAVTSTKSAAEIVKENTYPEPPAGRQRMNIVGFSTPEEKYFTVLLDGRETSYQAHVVNVKLGLESNNRAQIQEYLVMPPSNPTQTRAYNEGVDPKKPDGPKGWAASKFYHFLSAIGFDWEPGQPIPQAAKRLGNWKVYPNGVPRVVIADIKPGVGSRTGNDGKTYDNRAQAKLFKYERVMPDSVAMAILGHPQQQQGQQVPQAPVDRRAAVGLDSI